MNRLPLLLLAMLAATATVADDGERIIERNEGSDIVLIERTRPDGRTYRSWELDPKIAAQNEAIRQSAINERACALLTRKIELAQATIDSPYRRRKLEESREQATDDLRRSFYESDKAAYERRNQVQREFIAEKRQEAAKVCSGQQLATLPGAAIPSSPSAIVQEVLEEAFGRVIEQATEGAPQ